MFTRNIRDNVGGGMSRVKWQPNNESVGNNQNTDINADDLIAKAKKILTGGNVEYNIESDWFSGKNNTVEGLLKQIDASNIANRTKISNLLSSRDSESMDPSDPITIKLQSIHTRMRASYETLDAQKDSATATVVQDTKKASTDALRATIGTNSREKQAEDFVKTLGDTLSGELKTKFETMAITESRSGEGSETIKVNQFQHVSIPNFVSSLVEGTVYVADGRFGPSEARIAKDFIALYQANQITMKPLLEKMHTVFRAGQSLESRQKEVPFKKEGDNKMMVAYLSKVDNFDTYQTTGLDTITKELVNSSFAGVTTDPEYLTIISRALLLAGSKEKFNTLQAFKDKLALSPELKYTLLAGISSAARMSNSGTNALRDENLASGISENERKMIEMIETKKASLLDGLKDGFDNQLKKQIADGDFPAEKKDAAQKAIDVYIADLKTEGSTGWNIIAKNFGVVVTNKGIGGGSTVTMDLPRNILADNVSFGFGVSTGNPSVGVGITFDKSITPETKILYGWAGAPFIGVSSQFDKWHMTGIGGVGGGLISISRDMGNKDAEVKRMETLKSTISTLQQIDTLAKDINQKSTDINFAPDVSQYPTESADPTVLTQDRAKAINTIINTDIQNRLQFAGFDHETNPLIRSQMIYNALGQAVQSRIDQFHLDDATGGWSLKSLGIVLGSFAVVPFILPTASFGRLTYTRTLQTRETTKVTEGKSEQTDTATLFDAPIFEKDGGGYSLEFKNKEVNKGNIVLPPGAEWDTSADNSSVNKITGLKDYGIKVMLKGGTYTIAYDTTKPVTNIGAIEASAVAPESLTRITSISQALSNPRVRQALSHLWNNPNRKPQANIFANTLQSVVDGQSSVADAKAIFITLISKPTLLPEFKGLHDVLVKMTSERELQSALFDIRGGMMMDENQAKKVSKPKDGSVVVSETLADTQKRFAGMVNNPKMSSLLVNMGISATDYANMIVGNGNKITLGTPKPGIMGAIASLKTDTPYMARMPAGTVRFAQLASKDVTRDISGSASADSKGKMFDTILSPASPDAKNLRTNIASTLGVKLEQVTFDNLKDLMVNSTATINGRVIKMEGQKFGLCAYGDCTNPGITMQAGSISGVDIKSVPISAESTTTTPTTTRTTLLSSSVDTLGITGGGGHRGNKPEEPKPVTPAAGSSTTNGTPVVSQNSQINQN